MGLAEPKSRNAWFSCSITDGLSLGGLMGRDALWASRLLSPAEHSDMKECWG